MTDQPYLLTASPSDAIALSMLSLDVFIGEMDRLEFQDQCSVIIRMLDADVGGADETNIPKYFAEWMIKNREAIRRQWMVKKR